PYRWVTRLQSRTRRSVRKPDESIDYSGLENYHSLPTVEATPMARHVTTPHYGNAVLLQPRSSMCQADEYTSWATSKISRSVDILATVMRIRSRKFLGIVVSHGDRRSDDRSRTPALRADRPAGLQSGTSALPQPVSASTNLHSPSCWRSSVSCATRTGPFAKPKCSSTWKHLYYYGLTDLHAQAAARYPSRELKKTVLRQCVSKFGNSAHCESTTDRLSNRFLCSTKVRTQRSSRRSTTGFILKVPRLEEVREVGCGRRSHGESINGSQLRGRFPASYLACDCGLGRWNNDRVVRFLHIRKLDRSP